MSDSTQRIIGLAKRAARVESSSQLLPRHFLIASLADSDTRNLFSKKWNQGTEIMVPESWQTTFRQVQTAPEVKDKIPLGPGFKEVFQKLYGIHKGLPPLAHLMKGLLDVSDPAVAEFRTANPNFNIEEDVTGPDRPQTRLGLLMDDVSALQNKLSRLVIGQASAIQQISDAMFASRLYHRERDDNPWAVLLFLGPPGVGKTYTSQLIADTVRGKDPDAFLRLDMSSFADPNSYRALVGFEQTFQGAQPGILTSHVTTHKNAVILVDEVEKAHETVHNLFLQVLDRGILEDRYHKKNASFGGSCIIFTTNLGKDLYMSPNKSGFLSHFQVSRPEVLEALRSSTNPMTGQPALSAELCSRLAKGFPIMFNHLAPSHLEEIARLAINELDMEFERQLGIRISSPDDRLISLMVMRLGPDLDARTLSSGIPLMIKDAFRDVLNRHREELTSESNKFERLHALEIVMPEGAGAEYLENIYLGGDRVMLISDRPSKDLALNRFPEFKWAVRKSGRTAIDAMRKGRADFILLDLDLHRGEQLGEGAGAARALRRVRTVYPDLPVYLYSEREASELNSAMTGRLAASGGARGFVPGSPSSWTTGEASPLQEIRKSILREKHLREMFRTRKSIAFEWDTEIRFEDKDGSVIIRPKDVHEVTVVASKDRAARLTFTGIPSERFDQVAGAREAKRRLLEILTWMRNPETIRSMGVDIPTGILLEGPPGNGKTMLARAVAGEAGLPFFAANATDFSSKWVGESEKNVRELFERAAAYAPSILFIDEIDAIGARRSSDFSGVHDQILTQLLVSMDGFSKQEHPVFFLGATNRADLLDPAIKRPGRFDYVITVGDLDSDARIELLRIKTTPLPLGQDVDLDAIAKAAWGLSGAKLAQVAKEAAILAFREAPPGAAPGEIKVGMEHFREALTNVRYGLKQEGPRPDEEDMKMTAYHEAGHALVAEMEKAGSVHQATILPRGRALGFVESIPAGEFHSWTARELLARIRVALAGRCAESVAFGRDMISAGCSQDLQVATKIATMAVTEFGMSEDVGPLCLGELDRLLPQSAAADRAGKAIERIVREQEKAVMELLTGFRPALDHLAAKLMEKETVDGAYIAQIGKQVRAKLGGS